MQKSSKMQKYTIEGSPITVTYGEDKENGVYLCAYDERLRHDETAKEEEKKVFQNQTKDKNGLYFNIRTGGQESAEKVSKTTMADFLQKFGVPEKQIEELLKAKAISSKCEICKTVTTTSCSKCHVVYYCSKECQTKDWSIHKYFCGSLPIPKKLPGEKSVYGILLPEKEKNPRLVKVLLKEKDIGGEIVAMPDCRAIIGAHCDHRDMPYNPLKGNKPLPKMLVFKFRDNFLNDGSLPNQTVANITKGKKTVDWRGPILVIKLKDCDDSTEYFDMEMKDLSDVIDFLLWYGTCSNEKETRQQFLNLGIDPVFFNM